MKEYEQVPKSQAEIYHAVDGHIEYAPLDGVRVVNVKLVNGLGNLIPVRIFEKDLVSFISESIEVLPEKNTEIDTETEVRETQTVSPEIQITETSVPESEVIVEVLQPRVAVPETNLEEVPNHKDIEELEDTGADDETEIVNENQADYLSDEDKEYQDDLEIAASLDYTVKPLSEQELAQEDLINKQDQFASEAILKLANKQKRVDGTSITKDLMDIINGRHSTTEQERHDAYQQASAERFNGKEVSL